MTLFYSRATTGPGLHALIVGVSAYKHLPGGSGSLTDYAFGMEQLTSTALSAWKICLWLLERKDNLAVPLASIRLLLSPSVRELQNALKNEPHIADVAEATHANFEIAAAAWRLDAAKHLDNYTFFYFAGHGLRRSSGNDAVMLLADHGASPLRVLKNDVEVANIVDGMAPTDLHPNIARKQLYFVDSCRLQPTEFEVFRHVSSQQDVSVDKVFDVRISTVDDRAKSLYYAAIPGRAAPADGRRQTFFSMGLLECLNRLGAERRVPTRQWFVSSLNLASALTEYFKYLKSDKGIEQLFEPDPGADCDICYLDDIPEIDLEVKVDPPDALAHTRIVILDNRNDPVPGIPHPPFKIRLRAGIYKIMCEIQPLHQHYTVCGSDYATEYEPFWPPMRHVVRIACQ